MPDYCLAVDRARYAGEPVAAVAAVDRATAEDALERIRVEYEPLPAVVDPEAAIAPGAPLLYPQLGTNVIWHDTLTYGPVDEAMARADGVLRERFTIQRYASTPLETFGCIAEYDAGTDGYEFWTNDQRPGLTISVLAASLGVPQARVRLSCPDIGGGFGNKRRPAYLLICALLARATGRPVKWIEDRIENLTALMHACNGIMDVELAYRADGTVLALAVRDVADEGKNLITPTQHNLIKLGNIANGYRIPAVRYEAWSVLTNKCPSGANRGIGKPFMCFAIERAMALLAAAPRPGPGRAAAAQLRDRRARCRTRHRRAPSTTAATTPRPCGARSSGSTTRGAGPSRPPRAARAGCSASASPPRWSRRAPTSPPTRSSPAGAPRRARRRRRWCAWSPTATCGCRWAIRRAARATRRSSPRSWPTSSASPPTRSRWPAASTRRPRPGSTSPATTPTSSRSPTWARWWAPPRACGPSSCASPRTGWRPRSPISSWEAARSRCAARRTGGSRFAELARTAYADVLGLPPGEEPGLEARHAHQNPLAQPIDGERRVRSQLVFSNAAHCCLVEVDPRTGLVTILDYLVVHDCGRELNPLIVEGMVHGATAHGIGAALLEEFRYDAQGQLLTSTFMDYLKPTAVDVPLIDVDRLEHPSPVTPLGAKGVGEGGAIPGPAAVANAVEDALAHLGVVVRSLPITPEQVWRWLR